MKNSRGLQKLFQFVSIAVLVGCDVDKDQDRITDPGQTIANTWLIFGNGNYDSARTVFKDIINRYPDSTVAYSGLGWCEMQSDSLDAAATAFAGGSSKGNASADLYAGWAFVLNAQKKYAESNERILAALFKDSLWNFPYLLGLSHTDLELMRAQNFLLTGDYANALLAVNFLDPNFTADITTLAGRAALAAKIEELKSKT